ncbi:MAG: PAS domain S-box protein [Pseudomonadota bacterium]
MRSRHQLEIANKTLATTQRALVEQRLNFDEVERMAKMGSWNRDLKLDTFVASDTFWVIHQLPPDKFPSDFKAYANRFIDEPDEHVAATANIAALDRCEFIDGIRKIRLDDGEHSWLHFRTEPTLDPAGDVIGYRGIVLDVTSEKIKEQALIEATQKLREAQRIAHIGHFYWDAKSDELDVSDNYYSTFGLTNDRAFKTMQEWYDCHCHPDDRPDFADYQQRLKEAKPYRVVRRTIGLDGKLRHLEINAEPVLKADGSLTAYRGTVQDISSNILNLQRLEQSESRYRLISENMHDAVSLHEFGGKTLFCTPSIFRILGYSVNEVVGISPIPFIHSDDWRTIVLKLRLFQVGQREREHIEYRCRHIQGYYVWLQTIIVPVYDADNALLHFQALTSDVTQQHMAAESLQNSEARFRHLTELSTDWYWEQDSEYRFTFFSRENTVFLGLPRAAILGKTRWALFPNSLSTEGWAVHRATLDARKPFHDCVFASVTTEHIGYSSISGEPVFDHEGVFIGYRGVGVDITRRKQTEMALASRTTQLFETNQQLMNEVERRKTLERRVLLDIDMELAQVGLELHDDLGQDLTGIALLTKALERKLGSTGHSTAADAAQISDLVNRAIRHTRMISHGLSPFVWGESGLVEALAQLAYDIDSLGILSCIAKLDETATITDEVVMRSLYRIAQEAVNNALKHSEALHIRIALKRLPGRIQLVIADDGKRQPRLVTVTRAGTGLHSIRHRAQTIDATVKVRAKSAQGTVIRVVFELHMLEQKVLLPSIIGASNEVGAANHFVTHQPERRRQ